MVSLKQRAANRGEFSGERQAVRIEQSESREAKTEEGEMGNEDDSRSFCEERLRYLGVKRFFLD